MANDKALFEEFLLWKTTRENQRRSVSGPDPSHRGVTDANYVRGSDVREYPKMIYRKSTKDPKGFTTRIIESREEEDSARKQNWQTQPKEIHALLEDLRRAASGELVEATA